jgi:TrkA domain protein
MARIIETKLPGVGVRYDFATTSGDRVGVLVHRSGRRELLVYSSTDPSACDRTIELGTDDALALAELLGAPSIAEELATIQQEIEGLAIDWIRIDSDAPWAGRTLGDAAVHSATGVSIVALVGHGSAIAAPGPDDVLTAGLTAVAVGSPEGMTELTRHLRRT